MNGNSFIGKLEGKTPLITGSDSGIGRAIAIELKKQARPLSLLIILIRKAPEKPGKLLKYQVEKPSLFTLMLLMRNQLPREFGTIGSTFGKLDILVNNAALMDNLPLGERK